MPLESLLLKKRDEKGRVEKGRVEKGRDEKGQDEKGRVEKGVNARDVLLIVRGIAIPGLRAGSL